MKPVLARPHLSTDGPAYLAIWQHREGVPFELRNTDAGQAYPEHMGAFSALAILGGEMSANDPLQSLRRAELLVLGACRAFPATPSERQLGQLRQLNHTPTA